MTGKVFILAHAEARKGAAEYAMNVAPDNWMVRFSEARRDLNDNAALHAMIGEIAKRREWAGRKWPIEIWKRLLTASWSRATGEQTIILPALDGQGVEIVFRRTSDLTHREIVDLMSFIEAWDSETQ